MEATKCVVEILFFLRQKRRRYNGKKGKKKMNEEQVKKLERTGEGLCCGVKMKKTKRQTVLVEEMIEEKEKDIVELKELLFDWKCDPSPLMAASAEKAIGERKENKNTFCPYCGKRLAREDPPLRKLDGDLRGMLTSDKPSRGMRTGQLDKEIDQIVADAIFKVIDARLASMIPFEPGEPSAIEYIESCLEKMKNE